MMNPNNFNILRLIAASQVMLLHTNNILKIDADYLDTILYLWRMFPGVPIFFFISGFLISKSYEANSSLPDYTKNRAFRIFPALMVSGMVSTLIISFSGYLPWESINFIQYLTWFASQATVFQFYDPDFLAGYGIGQANGVLWTIYVELQFYLLIPVLYKIGSKFQKNSINFDVFLFILTGIFIIANRIYYANEASSSFFIRILAPSFVPYFYMFLVGVLFQRNQPFLSKYLSNRLLILLIGYVGIYSISRQYIDISQGNRIEPILYIMLCFVIYSFAFSCKILHKSVLQSVDISYGIYLYHMLIINLFVYLGLVGKAGYAVIVCAIVFFLALTSFKFIERPAIKLKSHPLNRVY